MANEHELFPPHHDCRYAVSVRRLLQYTHTGPIWRGVLLACASQILARAGCSFYIVADPQVVVDLDATVPEGGTPMIVCSMTGNLYSQTVLSGQTLNFWVINPMSEPYNARQYAPPHFAALKGLHTVDQILRANLDALVNIPRCFFTQGA